MRKATKNLFIRWNQTPSKIFNEGHVALPEDSFDLDLINQLFVHCRSVYAWCSNYSV